jgi:sporulation integral membrane protein YtvI
METTLTAQTRRELYTRLAVRLVVAGVVCWIVVARFGEIMSLVLPFGLAWLLSRVLNFAVERVEQRWHVPRRPLAFVLVCAVVAGLGALLYALGRQVVEELTQLLANWDAIRGSIMNTVSLLSQKLSVVAGRDAAEFQSDVIALIQRGLTWLAERIASWTPPVVEQAGNLAEQMFSFFLSCVMFFVACFYFTADSSRLGQKLWARFPVRLRRSAQNLKKVVGEAAGGYLKAQLILSGLVMVFVLAAFLIAGQRYAILLSFVVAVVDFIPIFGSGTILAPWAMVSLLSGDLGQCVFLLCLTAFLFVFRKVAEPKIVGNQTGLSTLTSLVCIYVGMKLDGVFGMIVTPIVCLVLLSLYRAGTFDSVLNDLRLLWHDLRGLMQAPARS